MNGALLADIGEALYGPYWHRELARALDVSDRTVRRWQLDTVPPARLSDLETLIRSRQFRLANLLTGITVRNHRGGG